MKKIPLSAIIGLGLMFVALISLFMVTSSFQKKTTIMVAKGDLSPYVRADDQLKPVQVPKASVTADDLTASEYKDKFVSKGLPVIPLIQFLAGQRVSEKGLASNVAASFGSVLPDERVIAVSATLAGSVLGTPAPGDVVDVQTQGSSNSQAVSQFDKILCITDKPTGCKDVVPASAVTSKTKSGGGLGGSTSSIYMLLAVPTSAALQLAGQQVLVSLNPFCRVGNAGRFYSVQKDQPCQAPQGRVASTPAPKQAVATPPATTTTGTTGTTTTSTTSTTTPLTTTTTK